MLKIAICDDEQPIRDYLKNWQRNARMHRSMSLQMGKSCYPIRPYMISFCLIFPESEAGQWQTKRHGSRKENQGNLRCDHYFCDCLKGICVWRLWCRGISLSLKPVDEQKFMEVMDKAISQIKRKRIHSRSLSEWMAITLRYRSTILFMRKMKREKSFCTRKTWRKKPTVFTKMEVLEQKLGDHFFRSHRGFLVNLQEVVRYDNANIELKNGDRVFLAKQKYNDFVTAYMNYLRKA